MMVVSSHWHSRRVAQLIMSSFLGTSVHSGSKSRCFCRIRILSNEKDQVRNWNFKKPLYILTFLVIFINIFINIYIKDKILCNNNIETFNSRKNSNVISIRIRLEKLFKQIIAKMYVSSVLIIYMSSFLGSPVHSELQAGLGPGAWSNPYPFFE